MSDTPETVIKPDDCICFKLYGRMACSNGHGFCPFLDPGGRNGNTRARLKEQIGRYRAAGIKPAFPRRKLLPGEQSPRKRVWKKVRSET